MQKFYLYNQELFTYEALCERLREKFNSADEIMEYVFPDLPPNCYFLWEHFTDEAKNKFLNEAIEMIIEYEVEVYMLNE